MPAPLKQIKNRIRGIENTRKVTAAMQMVSVAKLNRVDKMLYALRPYFSRLESVFVDLVNRKEELAHPLLENRASGGKICLAVVTSDSGLCGNYNHHIIRLAEEFIERCGSQRVGLVCIGKKGYNYFKKKQYEIFSAYMGNNGNYSRHLVSQVENDLINIFISGKVNQVYIAYTHYQTALVHNPLLVKFLNLERARVEKKDYILEPDIDGILARMIPGYLSTKLNLMILEAFTSEHSARTIAMKTATENASDLLQGLVVLRNKVRQANITSEIMEIISSTEALKG